MSEFKPFGKIINTRFKLLSQHELFVAGSGEALWEEYLKAFPAGTNPIFKTRTEHDCSCCRNFVKNLGNAVAIVNGEVLTLWDVEGLESPYREVAAALHKYVSKQPIASILRRSERSYGAEATRQLLDNNAVHTWNHFFATLENKHFTQNVAEVVGEANTTVQVFQRDLEELSSKAIGDVLELIDSNSIYRGAEHKATVIEFKDLLFKYNSLKTPREKQLFAFENYRSRSARFRNTAIGTLIQDLSSGVDLESAVHSFETKVAPLNYKRPTALITPRMIADATKTIQDLGIEPALDRRFATISDVSVNNVLWVDGTVKPKMKGGIEGLLLEAVKETSIEKPTKETEITIGDFMGTIVPKATSLAVLVENQHLANFVSITAPAQADTKQLFKWNNDFAWSYDGNVTDSIKERVKRAGGKTDVPLRFSLAWFNHDDLDFHVDSPQGYFYFANKGKVLDVDMNAGYGRSREPVENLAFSYPQDGVYRVFVNQYSRRETKDVGFTVEVQANNFYKQLSYNEAVHGKILVGTFEVKNQEIRSAHLNKKLVEAGISQTKWNVQTEVYTPVDTVLLSPNHWDDNAVGNKHWFFILKGCKNPESTRGIYNEFLSGNLEKHRKVFEVLGDRTKCPVAKEQLSGVGFSSTRQDSVSICATIGSVKKFYKVKF